VPIDIPEVSLPEQQRPLSRTLVEFKVGGNLGAYIDTSSGPFSLVALHALLAGG
jgi:hypothetical protein